MPTERLFSQYPGFPDDVPTASTTRVSLGELEDGSLDVSRAVLKACTEDGYFLLDLRTSEHGKLLLKAAESMFDTASETFDLGPHVLKAYPADLPRSLEGYKGAGRIKTDYGQKDASEFYTIHQDDMTGINTSKNKPLALEKRLDDCQNFIQRAYETVEIILSTLDKELDLPSGTLISRCSILEQSTTSVRLLRAHPVGSDAIENDHRPIKLGGHTDIGTITFVFNVLGGLQILPPGADQIEESWQYVRPEPGRVLVQVGDTLVEWTGGVLRSNLHRVVDPPGPQADLIRHSVAYLQRASDSASMQRLKVGNIIPPLREGEGYDTRSSSEWVVWRNGQIMQGKLKHQSHGGTRPLKSVTISA